MCRRFAVGLLVLLMAVPVFAQDSASKASTNLKVSRVHPPNWWVGMKWNRIELMVTGEGLDAAQFAFENDQLKIVDSKVAPSGKYAFLKFDVPVGIETGDYTLLVRKETSSVQCSFPILERNTDPKAHQGFGPSDLIYLITPDRFANGDTGNDRVKDPVAGMLDEYDPSQHGMRHGGDLQGIIEHLDYIEDLGVTTIWLNPVLENRGDNSYHGYATTDHYRVDPRFGTNELYREFVEEAHKRDLKVIFDHISNHIGVKHPWLTNLPANDWLNGSIDKHLTQKHYLLSISDPHADPEAEEMLKTFWFVDAMPDMNQRNEQLANYLIQNSIWWIEYSGIDGIREDTYPYADQAFMTRWAKAIMNEYPNFNIVGEIWAVHPAYLAQFQDESVLPMDFETHLPSMMDFPLMQVWRQFLTGDAKLRDVHQVYAQDFLYSNANNLVVFLDNHDISRAIFCAEDNVNRFKLALTVLATARGIPQVLYGTEIHMMGGESHVELRADFPGGFPSAESNAFTKDGRTARQQQMFEFCRTLFRLRKKHPALSSGKMIHYAPKWDDDTYVVLKVHDDEKVVILANGNETENHVDMSELEHHLAGATHFVDLFSGNSVKWKLGERLKVPAMSAKLFKVETEER